MLGGDTIAKIIAGGNMTSNQIAYAGFNETVRHDKAMEDINSEANRISADRNRYEEEYRRRVNDIQEEYNRKYIAMQEAQGQRKLDLQQELNWIEWRKTNIDSSYKANMAQIAEQNAKVNERNQIETERYQKTLNDLGFSHNEIEAQLANIKNKQAEYEKYWNENQVRIQDFNALINKQKVDNDYSLGLIRAEIDQTRNELQKELQEWQEATMFTNSVWQGVGTILGFARRGGK